MVHTLEVRGAENGQVIETERLTLQPLSHRFLSDIHREYTQPVAKFMHAQPGTIAETSSSITNRLFEVGGHYFVIVENETAQFFGCAGIRVLCEKVVLPRFWLIERAWFQGVGTEVLQALVHFVRQNLPCDFIYMSIDERNLPARFVIEKAGGKLQNHCYSNPNARGDFNLLRSYKIEL